MTTGIDGSHDTISSEKLITVWGRKEPLWFKVEHIWDVLLPSVLNSLHSGGLFVSCVIQLVFWEGLTVNTYSKMTKEPAIVA